MPRPETFLYRLTYHTVRFLLRLYVRFRVAGTEHVPRGPALIVANHPSALDPLVLAAALPRRGTFIAAAEFLSLRLVGWAMRAYGVIPVRRGQVDLSVIKEAIRALEGGALVALFPEGRISPEGGAVKAGAGLLASRVGVPIVPAAILGTGRALPLGRYIPRPARVRVVFGPPVQPPPGDRASADLAVEAALEWVRGIVRGTLDSPSLRATLDCNKDHA